METWVLVRPLEEAVMKNVPSAPVVATAVTTPAEIVAMVVLLENHVAVEVMGVPPLHVAVKVRVAWLGVRVPLVGVMTGAVVQATETVMGWVPLIDGSTFDVAVIVPVPPVPELAAVTRPLALIVAIGVPLVSVPEIDHDTGVLLLVVPSLKVPTANI
jgi:hypothetical protein